MIKAILLVGLGGGIGSVFRYLSSLLISKYWQSIFPLATFIVNTVGCLLIGLILGLLVKYQITNSELKFLLIIGFCGGYTTFSTFAVENINLIETDNISTALLYILSSTITGILAVCLGLFLGK